MGLALLVRGALHRTGTGAAPRCSGSVRTPARRTGSWSGAAAAMAAAQAPVWAPHDPLRPARCPVARFDFSRGLQEKCKNISFPFTTNNLPLILKNYFTDLHISQTITRLLPFTGILYVNEDRLGLHNRFPLKKALCGYFLLSGILVNCLVIIN